MPLCLFHIDLLENPAIDYGIWVYTVLNSTLDSHNVCFDHLGVRLLEALHKRVEPAWGKLVISLERIVDSLMSSGQRPSPGCQGFRRYPCGGQAHPDPGRCGRPRSGQGREFDSVVQPLDITYCWLNISWYCLPVDVCTL